MAIPDYQAVMLPVLTLSGDGREHHIREAINTLAEQFGLTEGERKELLPSGVDRVFDNRIGWARTYLKKAGMIEYPQKGYFRITDRGKSILAQKPSQIDLHLLKQYPEFLDFYAPKKTISTETVDVTSGEQTPEEALAAGYTKLRKQIEADVLARVKASPPEFFERLVVMLLTTMGVWRLSR
jgi:restriction system protein